MARVLKSEQEMSEYYQRIKKIIAELVAQRDILDRKIAALQVAVEALGEDEPRSRAAPPRTSARRVARDPRAAAKTLGLLSERKRPLTVTAAARAMGVTQRVAASRLGNLARTGRAERVSRGHYLVSTGN
jgi:hypothetical protein